MLSIFGVTLVLYFVKILSEVRQIEEQKLWKTYHIERQFHVAFILCPEG
jgi:hypothetical protein